MKITMDGKYRYRNGEKAADLDAMFPNASLDAHKNQNGGTP